MSHEALDFTSQTAVTTPRAEAPGRASRTRPCCHHVGIIVAAIGLAAGVSGCPTLTVFQCAMEYGQEYQEAINSLSSVNVRIVNETDVSARVELDAGVTPVLSDRCSDLVNMTGTGPVLATAEPVTVVVAAHGTATGTAKCGEVIGISATTPGTADWTYITASDAFGLYIPGGNIVFTGAGSSTDTTFVGDVEPAATGRFIRPTADGLNCTTGTIVITIQTPGTPSAVNPDTGQVVAGTTGTGTVQIE
jgi:hypothetical protein